MNPTVPTFTINSRANMVFEAEIKIDVNLDACILGEKYCHMTYYDIRKYFNFVFILLYFFIVDDYLSL